MLITLLKIGLNNSMQRPLSHQSATHFETILRKEMITYLKRSAHSHNDKLITFTFFTLYVKNVIKDLLFQSLYLTRKRVVEKLLTGNLCRSKNVKIDSRKTLFLFLLT